MALRHRAQHARLAVAELRTLKADHPYLWDVVDHHDCRTSLLEQENVRPQAVCAASSIFITERCQIDTVGRNISKAVPLQPPMSDA